MIQELAATLLELPTQKKPEAKLCAHVRHGGMRCLGSGKGSLIMQRIQTNGVLRSSGRALKHDTCTRSTAQRAWLPIGKRALLLSTADIAQRTQTYWELRSSARALQHETCTRSTAQQGERDGVPKSSGRALQHATRFTAQRAWLPIGKCALLIHTAAIPWSRPPT